MDWLTDNAIANMYGPHFLLLYGIVILFKMRQIPDQKPEDKRD